MLGISEILYLNYFIALTYTNTILTQFSNPHSDGISLNLLVFDIIDTYIRIKLLNVTRMKQQIGSPNNFLVRKISVKVKFVSCKIMKTKIYSICPHYNFTFEIIKSLTKNMSHLFSTNLSLLSPSKTLSLFYITDKYCIYIFPGCENYMFIFTSKIKSKLLLQQIFIILQLHHYRHL